MKYTMISAAVLSCVFFESECGFGRFLEKAGRDIGKASQNIAKATEREVRNLNEGTIRPAAENIANAYENHVRPEIKSAEKNISKNNDRFKSWFHREAQPKVKEWYHGTFLKEIKRIEKSISDLRDRISRGETQGADQDIQNVRQDIHKLGEDEVNQSNVAQNEEVAVAEGPTKEDIEEQLGIAKKELEIKETSLETARLKSILKSSETDLSEDEKYKLKIEILNLELEVKIKELEILKLEASLKKAD